MKESPDALIHAQPLPARQPLIPYENRLERNAEWAMSEGSKFFEEKSQVQAALAKITAKLGELGIDYVVIGGMALFRYGYRRFTEDVDLLVTRESLEEIHRRLDGLGYLPPFEGSKNLRDAESGVKIEFLRTGDFPGDGKPKPVAFPTPGSVATEIEGIRYINLPNLIDLKLASGMTSSERIRDLADVLELIKVRNLPLNTTEDLNPFVRATFTRLWHDAHPRSERFVRLIWKKIGIPPSGSLAEMVDETQLPAETLRLMLAEGVTLEPVAGATSNYLRLVTTDADIAKKYDMHKESDFMSAGDL